MKGGGGGGEGRDKKQCIPCDSTFATTAGQRTARTSAEGTRSSAHSSSTGASLALLTFAARFSGIAWPSAKIGS